MNEPDEMLHFKTTEHLSLFFLLRHFLSICYQREMPIMDISPTAGSFHSSSFTMIFVYYKSTKTPKNHLIWCSG